MAPAGRSLFVTRTGSLDFNLETTWRLLVPDGPPPPGGWPLVIALHGMGMTAAQFSLVLNDLLLPKAAFLFPQGVYPYEIRRDGKIRVGYAWYVYDGTDEPFRTTVARSEAHLMKLLERVSTDLPINQSHVHLLGFSMGAYLGYVVALRNSERFAGLVAIGGRMKDEFVADNLESARRFPVLIVHGEKDRAVALERARGTYETLLAHGFPVEMRVFPVGHEIRAVEVEAVREWLEKRLAAETS